VLGTDAAGMFAGATLARMADRHELALVDLRRIGPDCRLSYAVKGR
jgi:hypothetical protein